MNGEAHGKSVLLLGNYRPVLPLARALCGRGYRVLSGSEGCDHCAEFSRHITEIWKHPPLNGGATVFLDALNDLLKRRRDIDLVIPVEEAFVRLFAEKRDRLASGVRVAMTQPGLVNAFLDKAGLLERAASAEVPVAPFRLVDSLQGLHSALLEIGYPVVIRPGDSTRRLFEQKALTLLNAEQAGERFSVWPADHRSLLVQRKVPGIRHNCYFAADDGQIKRYLHAIITRTDRTDGSGLAVEGLTVEPDPALLSYTQTLVAEYRYSGIGCAQYLVDRDSGQTFFLEINPRIAGNHAVPEYCGLDLGGFLLDGDDGSEIRFGRTGVRYSWVAGDLEGLKAGIKNGEIGLIAALQRFFQLAANLVRSDIDMLINWRDPLPGIVALIDVLPGIGHLTRLRKVRAQPRAESSPSGARVRINAPERKAQ